jgi:hypothetical protein
MWCFLLRMPPQAAVQRRLDHLLETQRVLVTGASWKWMAAMSHLQRDA